MWWTQLYLKTREYGGASFVDKKSTVIFYQKNFCWIVLEGKKMLFEFFKKNLCGFFVHKWRSTIFPVCGFFVHNSQIGVKSKLWSEIFGLLTGGKKGHDCTNDSQYKCCYLYSIWSHDFDFLLIRFRWFRTLELVLLQYYCLWVVWLSFSFTNF